MEYVLVPPTFALASDIRFDLMDAWDRFDPSNVLTASDATWNAGCFAPVSLTVGWASPRHRIVGLYLLPDMLPREGEVEVQIRSDGRVVCLHKSTWTHQTPVRILFPRVLHTAEIALEFVSSPSWIALFWVLACQQTAGPSVVKSPVSLWATRGTLRRRRRRAIY
jgi:hypothetical protein